MFGLTSQAPLAPREVFIRRLIGSVLLAFGVIVVSLGIGMTGYHWLAGLGWVDAFLNASMILGGMGPVNVLDGTLAKLFAGVYALFSGLVLVGATGLVLGPILHRMLHKFHLDDIDLADDDRQGPRM
ncbi:MAG: hypothetical protein JSU08_18230 [Acidobacteria bacterium]|nr:hypothetical protein [Acidobacteriota bacterium]